MSLQRTGDWKRAQALIERAGRGLGVVVRRALAQEAHALRAEIVAGLDRQAPGGAAFTPLATLTLAARRLRRQRGTKALIRTAELRNALAVLRRGGEVFVGIPEAKRGSDGQSLAKRAEQQEYGTQPTIIPITPRMRRFLAALYREAGQASAASGPGAGVVVVQVPARPFLRPVMARFQIGAGRRFLDRVSGLLEKGA